MLDEEWKSEWLCPACTFHNRPLGKGPAFDARAFVKHNAFLSTHFFSTVELFWLADGLD